MARNQNESLQRCNRCVPSIRKHDLLASSALDHKGAAASSAFAI
jgi:hypothetical protein